MQDEHQQPVFGLIVVRVRGQTNNGARRDADKGCQIRRAAGYQNADEQKQRYQSRPAHAQGFAQLGHFFFSQPAQSVALGFKVNLHEHAKEMHEGRYCCGRHDGLVGQVQKLDHQESRSAQHRRRDLTAGRGCRFHCRRKVALVAHADHGRNGQGTHRHGIGH